MCARYDEDWIASLMDVEVRLGGTPPGRCLRDAGVRESQTVVDYGCGPGLFTFPAAEIVGAGGRVYAVDIEPRMVSMVAEEAARLGAENVTALLNEGGGAPLPSDTADFLILGQVIHYPDDTADRVAIVEDAARLLRASGRCLVIEWIPQGGEARNRIAPEETERIVTEAGLRVTERLLLGPRQYAMIATHR